MNGNTIGFDPQTHNLISPHKTPSFNMGVKEFIHCSGKEKRRKGKGEKEKEKRKRRREK